MATAKGDKMELVLNQCEMCGDLFESNHPEQLCNMCQIEIMTYDPNDDPRDYDEDDRL